MRPLSQNSPGQRYRTRFPLGFTEYMPGKGEKRNSREVNDKKSPLNKYRGRKIPCLSIKEKPPSLRGPHRGSPAHFPAPSPHPPRPSSSSHSLTTASCPFPQH